MANSHGREAEFDLLRLTLNLKEIDQESNKHVNNQGLTNHKF